MLLTLCSHKCFLLVTENLTPPSRNMKRKRKQGFSSSSKWQLHGPQINSLSHTESYYGLQTLNPLELLPSQRGRDYGRRRKDGHSGGISWLVLMKNSIKHCWIVLEEWKLFFCFFSQYNSAFIKRVKKAYSKKDETSLDLSIYHLSRLSTFCRKCSFAELQKC